MTHRRTRLVGTLALAAGLLAAGLTVAPGAAQAACGSKTTKSISGTITGQDNLDVNTSIGFDVMDKNGHPIWADPTQSNYGCAKSGGYSVPQKEYNHFVDGQGVPAGTTMSDGHKTTRTWVLPNLPSNAGSVWIEVYTRGYHGSPCRDSKGNYCFNPTDRTKYGFANLHFVPVGSKNVAIKLPLLCSKGGTAGTIQGTVKSKSGAALTAAATNAWTTAKFGAAPSLKGWGTGVITSGKYSIPGLASGQSYSLWGRYNGVTQKRTVTVSRCKTTTVNFVF